MLKTKYHTAYQYACNHGGFIACKHNRHINCFEGADCKSCGWNPVVETKRKAMLKTLFKKYYEFMKG